RLRLAIGLLPMPTAARGLARVGGVYVDHRHARQRRLVGDEGPKLSEGPTMQHSPLPLPNRFPRALPKPFQVFEGDPALGAFGSADNSLAQTMVDVAGKGPFLATALAQQPFGRLRALLLELAPQTRVARPHLINMGVLGAGGVVQELPIACRRQRDDPQVYAQVLGGLQLVWLWLRRVHRHRQKVGICALAVEQIGLPALALQHPRCVGAEAEGDVYSPGQRQQSDAIRA